MMRLGESRANFAQMVGLPGCSSATHKATGINFLHKNFNIGDFKRRTKVLLLLLQAAIVLFSKSCSQKSLRGNLRDSSSVS
jgi:hypothetical protein